MFRFNYKINKIGKKSWQKVKKTRESSKTDVSDFKLEVDKIFLTKFFQRKNRNCSGVYVMGE